MSQNLIIYLLKYVYQKYSLKSILSGAKISCSHACWVLSKRIYYFLCFGFSFNCLIISLNAQFFLDIISPRFKKKHNYSITRNGMFITLDIYPTIMFYLLLVCLLTKSSFLIFNDSFSISTSNLWYYQILPSVNNTQIKCIIKRPQNFKCLIATHLKMRKKLYDYDYASIISMTQL